MSKLVEEYWKAVAQGIDAENRKAALFVRHRPSLGVAREAILRNLIERQTPAPFTVATGFAFAHPDPSIQPEPHFSRQCDLLVYDPTIARPLYAIDAFAVVNYIACRFVIEVKSLLNKTTFKELLAVWLSIAGLGIPTFGFAYNGDTFRNFLQLLSATAAADSPNPEYSLARLPECICVHKRNFLGFRRRASDKHAPEQYMAMNFGVEGDKAIGAATGQFLSFYDTALRRDEVSEMNRPWLFDAIPLPPEAKAWIDRGGKIAYGNLPMKPANPQ